MKKLKFITGIGFIGALTFLLMAWSYKQDEEPMDLYLLIGQSNMAGRGIVDSLSNVKNPNILMLDKENNWVVATDPLHFDKKVAGVGPGLSFAQVMLGASKGKKIGLIPCAVGGTSIAKWRPGGYDKVTNTHPYDDAILRARIAMKSGTLKGILWHQGEGDSGRPEYVTYPQRFDELLDSLGKDLNIPIHSMPVVIGQIGRYYIEKYPHGYSVQFNELLMKMAAERPNVLCVSSEGLTHIGDTTHFDTKSSRELGKRYAEAMKRLQRKQL